MDGCKVQEEREVAEQRGRYMERQQAGNRKTGGQRDNKKTG